LPTGTAQTAHRIQPTTIGDGFTQIITGDADAGGRVAGITANVGQAGVTTALVPQAFGHLGLTGADQPPDLRQQVGE
jgi:hypothetical protein